MVAKLNPESTSKMKALTIRNPFAWLIARGIKDIENRSWKTNYRGTILVHAAMRWDKRASNMSFLFTHDQWDSLPFPTRKRMVMQTDMPTSAIIGQVDIADCVQGHDSVWAEKEGWNWVLENPVFYDNFIPNVRGSLSFWDFSLPSK